VIKKATSWHPDEQVAEWGSKKVAPHDLWAFIYCLSHIYTVRDHTGHWREPLVVVEINHNAGDAVQTEMLKRGYSNFYRQIDMTITGMTGSMGNQKPRALRDRIGWKTDRINRPRMLSLFRTMVRDGTFIPRSPFLVNEMSTLEYNLDKKRIEASEGRHDDRVIGPCLVLSAWYDSEVQGREPSAYLEHKAYESQLAIVPSYLGDKVIGGSSRYAVPVPDKSDSRILYASS
jgi:hypothetical protein